MSTTTSPDQDRLPASDTSSQWVARARFFEAAGLFDPIPQAQAQAHGGYQDPTH